MALPTELDTRTIVLKAYKANGDPETGKVTFTLEKPIQRDDGTHIVTPVPIPATLDSQGAAGATLALSSDDDYTPDTRYKVDIQLSGWKTSYYITLDETTPDPVELFTLIPAEPPAPGQSYLTITAAAAQYLPRTEAAGFLTTTDADQTYINKDTAAEQFVTRPNLPARVLFYYGAPHGVNGLWDAEQAATLFTRWDVVVFGDRLQEPDNPNHQGLLDVIGHLGRLRPETRVYGYVDLGVSTQNRTVPDMQSAVGQWKQAGAHGIFWDDAGYDFQVTRDRQNTMVDYTHDQGMSAFMNPWNQDDVCSPNVHANNPGGTPARLDARDLVMLESWAVNTNAYANNYATISDLKTRADKARAYRNTQGVRFAAFSVVEYSLHTDEQIRHFFDVTEALALIFGADGYGVDAYQYSATGADVGVVKPWTYQRAPLVDAAYWLSNDWATLARQDEQIIAHWDGTDYTITRGGL